MELKLTITLDTATGQLRVDGPIQDLAGCYGMLELAKDAIRERARAGAQRIVAAPASAIPPSPGNGRS